MPSLASLDRQVELDCPTDNQSGSEQADFTSNDLEEGEASSQRGDDRSEQIPLSKTEGLRFLFWYCIAVAVSMFARIQCNAFQLPRDCQNNWTPTEIVTDCQSLLMYMFGLVWFTSILQVSTFKVVDSGNFP